MIFSVYSIMFHFIQLQQVKNLVDLLEQMNILLQIAIDSEEYALCLLYSFRCNRISVL